MKLPALVWLSVASYHGVMLSHSAGRLTQDDVDPIWGSTPSVQQMPIFIPGTSSITKLTFHSSEFEPNLLKMILQVPRCLEQFHYSPLHLCLNDVDIALEVGFGLQSQKHTLKELIIEDMEHSFEDVRDGSVLGSLNDFTTLQHIRLPLPWLLGLHPDNPSHLEMPLVNPLD